MKKNTISWLIGVPGARVSAPDGVLHVNGQPASVPWFKNTLEVGVLLALPRVGMPMAINATDPLSLGRYIGPALFDVFEKVATLRKFLGLKPATDGEFVTSVEAGSEGIAREVVDVLRKMPKSSDWKSRLVVGIASAVPDALSNGLAVHGGGADWAAAIIEAVEAT